MGDDATPAGLRLVNGLVEEVIEKKGFQVGGLLICLGDVTEEDRLDQGHISSVCNHKHEINTLMIHPPRHMRAIPA